MGIAIVPGGAPRPQPRRVAVVLDGVSRTGDGDLTGTYYAVPGSVIRFEALTQGNAAFGHISINGDAGSNLTFGASSWSSWTRTVPAGPLGAFKLTVTATGGGVETINKGRLWYTPLPNRHINGIAVPGPVKRIERRVEVCPVVTGGNNTLTSPIILAEPGTIVRMTMFSSTATGAYFAYVAQEGVLSASLLVPNGFSTFVHTKLVTGTIPQWCYGTVGSTGGSVTLWGWIDYVPAMMPAA